MQTTRYQGRPRHETGNILVPLLCLAQFPLALAKAFCVRVAHADWTCSPDEGARIPRHVMHAADTQVSWGNTGPPHRHRHKTARVPRGALCPWCMGQPHMAMAFTLELAQLLLRRPPKSVIRPIVSTQVPQRQRQQVPRAGWQRFCGCVCVVRVRPLIAWYCCLPSTCKSHKCSYPPPPLSKLRPCLSYGRRREGVAPY